MQRKGLKKYNGNKKEAIYLRWSNGICIRTVIRIWDIWVRIFWRWRGESGNDNNIEHIGNANGNDADGKISDKKPSNKNEKRLYRCKQKESIVFDTSLKEKNLALHERMLQKWHHYSTLSYFGITISLNISCSPHKTIRCSTKWKVYTNEC